MRAAGMRKGGRSVVKARPAYGYQHPTCSMLAPAGVSTDVDLAFDLQLLDWLPADQARRRGGWGVGGPGSARAHSASHNLPNVKMTLCMA